MYGLNPFLPELHMGTRMWNNKRKTMFRCLDVFVTGVVSLRNLLICESLPALSVSKNANLRNNRPVIEIK